MPTLQEIINNEIAKGRKPRAVDAWHPSGFGSCMTGRYLERRGIQAVEDFDERTLRVFSLGNHVEEWALGLVEKAGIGKLTRQVRVESKELDIKGSADAVVDLGGAHPLLYELKSIHSQGFTYLKKTGAKIQHKMQAWTYMHLLNIAEGRILYISKDDLRVDEFPIFLDDENLKAIVMDEIAILNESWKKQLPPPPPPADDWRAKYCRWHSLCVNQPEYLKVEAGLQKNN